MLLAMVCCCSTTPSSANCRMPIDWVASAMVVSSAPIGASAVLARCRAVHAHRVSTSPPPRELRGDRRSDSHPLVNEMRDAEVPAAPGVRRYRCMSDRRVATSSANWSYPAARTWTRPRSSSGRAVVRAEVGPGGPGCAGLDGERASGGDGRTPPRGSQPTGRGPSARSGLVTARCQASRSGRDDPPALADHLRVLPQVGLDQVGEQEVVEGQQVAPPGESVGLEAVLQHAHDALGVLQPLVGRRGGPARPGSARRCRRRPPAGRTA